MEIIFTAFGVQVRKDDLGMRPLKFRHKCYKLALTSGNGEGMSGTLSFQFDPAPLSFSEEVKNLQSFRG